MTDGRTFTSWNDEENERFFEAIKLYGNNQEEITAHVGTRSLVHIRNKCMNTLRMHRLKPDLPDAQLIIDALTPNKIRQRRIKAQMAAES